MMPADLSNPRGLRLGMVHWERDTELISLIAATTRDLGCTVTAISAYDRLPAGLEAVLAFGPFGSLAPLGTQLSRIPAGERPALVLWMTEQFSNPRLPIWLQRMAGAARSSLERLIYQEQPSGHWRCDERFQRLTRSAYRLRYFGDLAWLQGAGILTVLAVGSRWIAEYLRRRGFPASVAFIGSHPGWGGDLNLERDVPVLWLGKIASPRRKEILETVRSQLAERGLNLLMIDGEENPYVFGEERKRLLSRTRVVLNVLREPWDNHSLRYFLAAPNRAMVVTEPTLSHTPFTPGVHLVAAPVEKLAETIAWYVDHAEERERIADRAFNLVTTELTMHQTVASVLAQVPRLWQTARRGSP